YAINPDGSKKWAFKTGNLIRSSPAIGSDGTIYVGSDDNYLYATNPDGSKKWALETGNWVRSSPEIGSDGTIYVGSDDNYLYAINLDGSEKWAFMTGNDVDSSPAIGSDGTIYVGSRDDNLYAINPDGSKKWAFKTGFIVVSSPAIGSDGTLYVGSGDANLYAINPDGSKKWAFKTGRYVESYPAIGSDETIYVGSNNLYAVNGSKIISNHPSIISHPVSLNAKIGKSVLFSVKANSKFRMDYQWYKNGVEIINEKNEILSIDNIEKKDYADYSVKIKNEFGEIISRIAQLMPLGISRLEPEILAQPKDLAVKVGSNAEFSVTAAGLEPLEYLWYKNGVAIPAATKPVLKIDNFKFSDYGRYLIKIKNNFGEAISQALDATSPVLYEISGDSERFENVNKLSPAYDDNIIYRVSNIYSGGTTYFDRFNSMIDTPVEKEWRVLASRANNGKKIWSFTDSGAAVTDPVIGTDKNIYIGTDDGNINCINNGKLKWSVKINSKSIYNPAVSFDGTIYVGSDKGLYAIDPDGSIIWAYDAIVVESPFIGRDGIIYSGISDKNLYAFNNDGVIKWKHEANGNITSPGAIGSNGVICFGTDANSLNAVNRDGTKKWIFNTAGIVELSPAIDKSGIIYCIDSLKNLYALNSLGELEWELKVSNLSSPTLGSNNLIVVGNEIIDAEQRKVLYNYPIQNINILSPMYKDAPFWLEPWEIAGEDYGWGREWETVKTYTGKTSIIDDTGRVFFADSGFTVHVYKIESDGFKISDSPWAMSGNNPKRDSFYSNSLVSFPLVLIDHPNRVLPQGIDVELKVIHETGYQNNYQWKKDGINIEGGTGAVLKIKNITIDDAGKYIIIVKNILGEFESDLIEVDVAKETENFFKSHSKINTPPSVSLNDILHITTENKEVIAINTDGKIKWQSTLGGEAAASPVIGNDGSVYVVSKDDNIYGLNKDGSTKWVYKTEGALYSEPALSDSDTLYVGYGKTQYLRKIKSDELKNSKHKYVEDEELWGGITGAGERLSNKSSGGLLAINTETGDLIWQLKDKVDTTVFFEKYYPSWSGLLPYALTAAGGWEVEIVNETGSHFKFSPVIGSNNILYACANEYVYSIDANNGNINWKTKVGYTRVCSPLALINSSQIVFGTHGINHEVQTEPGGEYINEFGNWVSYPPSYDIRWLESPRVHLINAKTGKIKWSKFHERMTRTAVAGSDKSIYLTIDKTKYSTLNNEEWYESKAELIKLNPANGGTVKSLEFDTKFAPFSAINSDNKFFHANGQNLNLVNINGENKNQADFQSNIESLIIDVNGRTFITVDNDIYSIKGESIADSKWPMANGNPQRTGSQFSIIEDIIEVTSFNNQTATFSLTFETKSESTYTIEVTQDFQQWSEIGEVQGTGTSVKFTDLRGALFQKQYYRVKKAE
ncbi:MAG: PQQ-binding-like beta-propeller repeat protein, partial [Flavobacteriales bacterium]|nr:PQQ-binding-like beta-propeller repeat protein [Flavobacteriales bacterium]